MPIMNQDNMSTALWYLWIIAMGAAGALNLRGIIKNIQDRKHMEAELKAKDIKIIMLESRILALETINHDITANRNSE